MMDLSIYVQMLYIYLLVDGEGVSSYMPDLSWKIKQHVWQYFKYIQYTCVYNIFLRFNSI